MRHEMFCRSKAGALWKILFGTLMVLVNAGRVPAVSAELTPATVASGERRMAEIPHAASGGGLVVHVGCGDGSRLADLAQEGVWLAHGLDRNRENITKARELLMSKKLYGVATVEQWHGQALPYANDLINLLIVEDPETLSKEEILRVLAPSGRAWICRNKAWETIEKKRPPELDAWTHFLHSADNNPVSSDSQVSPPRSLQWQGLPKWTRSHETTSSLQALVATETRIFYIFDEGSSASIQLPARVSLICRDAFNGIILWRRPITKWFSHHWPLKSGPHDMPRRLVAVGDKVYTTLGIEEPLSILDAATGKTLVTIPETRTAQEIVVQGDVVLAVVNPTIEYTDFKRKSTFVWDDVKGPKIDGIRKIVALDGKTGRVLWTNELSPGMNTLCADASGAYFFSVGKLVALDLKTGKTLWEIKADQPSSMAVVKGVVLTASKMIMGYSTKDGKKLWESEHSGITHHCPQDILVAGGLAWSMFAGKGVVGRDIVTGAVVKEFNPAINTYWFHPRCHRSKATDKYLIPSRTGIEFIDIENKTMDINHWTRGGCFYGIMPANGLVYAPQHSCACYPESKTYGLSAMAPARTPAPLPTPDDRRLEVAKPAVVSPARSAGTDSEWPTFRHDNLRSGSTATPLPQTVAPLWSFAAGTNARLTTLTAAQGKVFVADKTTHQLYAMDAHSGRMAWSFVADAQIDSPPTIADGFTVFGCRDGRIYCLNAENGELIWRYQVAPFNQRIMADEQLESTHPVSGSVLVKDAHVYAIAGRSRFFDGGLSFIKLELATGKKAIEQTLNDITEDGKPVKTALKGLTMMVSLPDLLSADNERLYMRSQALTFDGKLADGQEHLFSPNGYLDDTWHHRAFWVYGKNIGGGWGGWFVPAMVSPEGRILVMDDKRIFGYGRRPEHMGQTFVMEYQLYSVEKDALGIDQERDRRYKEGRSKISVGLEGRASTEGPIADWKLRKKYVGKADLVGFDYKWANKTHPFFVKAMVLAQDKLAVAGPPDLVDEEELFDNKLTPDVRKRLDEQEASLKGQAGSSLWILNAETGEKLSALEMKSPPVFDGMIAAYNRLYISTMDGKVLCLGQSSSQTPKKEDGQPR